MAEQMQTQTQAQLQQQQQKGKQQNNRGLSAEAVQAAPRKRKRKQRPEHESPLPEEMSRCLPQCEPYVQLKQLERRLDAAFSHRMAEARDATHGMRGQSERTLRLYVFNTFDPGNENSIPPSWTLHLHARLLPSAQQKGAQQTQAAEQKQASEDASMRFSDCIRSCRVWLSSSREQPPDVAWSRESSPASSSAIDGFEIKREGSEPIDVLIELGIDHGAERYRLSEPMARLLGLCVATKAVVITALWRYVRQNRLQSDDDPSNIVCDENLRAIFNKPNINIASLSDKLKMHLRRTEPLLLEYRIDTSGPGPFCRECYDIQIDAPQSSRPLNDVKLNSIAQQWHFEQMDERIASTAQRLRQHLQKRDFFESFAQSPGRFMQSLVAAQAADLRTFTATSDRQALERWSGYYSQQWAHDAAARYLHERKRSGV